MGARFGLTDNYNYLYHIEFQDDFDLYHFEMCLRCRIPSDEGPRFVRGFLILNFFELVGEDFGEAFLVASGIGVPLLPEPSGKPHEFIRKSSQTPQKAYCFNQCIAENL